MKKNCSLPPWFLLAFVVLLAGCTGAPAIRFYTLTPLEQQSIRPASPEAGPPVSLRIAPVEIPDYLDRPQMVTRNGQNELHLAEFDRWAGSLRENMAGVLAENLSILLGSDRIFVTPRVRTENTDYLLALRILRLDCVPVDQVFLKAQWTLFAGQDRTGAAHMVALSEPLADSRYESLAAAVSRVLGRLSREIALSLRQ